MSDEAARSTWVQAGSHDDQLLTCIFDRRLNHPFKQLVNVLSEIRDLRALEHASHGEVPDAAMMTTLVDVLQAWALTVQAPEQLLSDTMHAIVDGFLRMRRSAAADRNASLVERDMQ